MGRPTQRMSMNAENPPCVLAMMFKSPRGMQRALMSLHHEPWIGMHPSRMSKSVATLMTAKNVMRAYVYL